MKIDQKEPGASSRRMVLVLRLEDLPPPEVISPVLMALPRYQSIKQEPPIKTKAIPNASLP